MCNGCASRVMRACPSKSEQVAAHSLLAPCRRTLPRTGASSFPRSVPHFPKALLPRSAAAGRRRVPLGLQVKRLHHCVDVLVLYLEKLSPGTRLLEATLREMLMDEILQSEGLTIGDPLEKLKGFRHTP